MRMEDVAEGRSRNGHVESIPGAPTSGRDTLGAKVGRVAMHSGEPPSFRDMLESPDPRRITRTWVDDIRLAAEFIEGGHGARPVAEHRKPWAARLRAYAEILESCLPPR